MLKYMHVSCMYLCIMGVYNILHASVYYMHVYHVYLHIAWMYLHITGKYNISHTYNIYYKYVSICYPQIIYALHVCIHLH